MTTKFSSPVRSTSFSLHPETIARLKLTSEVLSKKYDRRISMSKIVERATQALMDQYSIRQVKRATPAQTSNAAKSAAARKRAMRARKAA